MLWNPYVDTGLVRALGPMGWALGLALVIFVPPPPAWAAPQDPSEEAPTGVQVRDATVLEAFFDGMLGAALREKGIAGATVAVVGGGEILFTKGYGWADVEARRPVDPHETLFRLASVTKLFTWVALMQLAEQGEVDLHGDLNQYLDLRIPETFPDPITPFHLLTHTAGFEEEMRDLFAWHPNDMVPLGQWLRVNFPQRVRPPGTFSSYSNHGTALAGYLVEQVSGLSWEAYLETHLLGPLGMHRTSAREPLPEPLADGASTGYRLQDGRLMPMPFELSKGGAPAGSASSTAADMGRFMLAILGGGILDGVRVLDQGTVEAMLSTQFSHDPRLPGFGLGFFEMNSHGVRILGHGGNSLWFHNVLALFPDHDLGLFVSFNTDTAAPLTYGSFLTTFLDRFFPDPPPAPEAVAHGSLDPLTGTYRFNRISYTTFQKAAGLVFGLSVREDEGVLVVGSPLGRMRMVQVEPGLFREEHGSSLVAFRTDEAGRGTHAFLSMAPMMAAERVPWHGAPALHFAILGGGLLVFLGFLVAAPVGWWRRRRTGSRSEGEERSVVLVRLALLVAAAAHLAFVVSVAVMAAPDPFAFLTTPMTGFTLALTLPVLGTIAAFMAGAGTAIQWWKGAGTPWTRLGTSGLVVVALLFAWSLHYWNLLGWRL
ncbi:MAG: class A beta-lactamase-related serine hydrolase [Gemmatimonadales bacterium]|nr:MAG: class A beta-lactamase-related serine hydrolase [Gemmatimonadales bacterium]